MILVALMFVLGAWNVQQLAFLPSTAWLAGMLIFAILLISLQYYPRSARYFHQHVWLRKVVQGASALMLGVCWASGFAMWRMSDELPHAWEQKTITIIGVVSSVPEVAERGTRFRFNVEQVLTPTAIVPKHISLSRYQDNFSPAYPANQPTTAPMRFHAGERWQLVVRLKQPHGTANPHGFDFEGWALSENIRATGSLKNKGQHKRLQTLVYQPQYLLERLRENVQNNIAVVLNGKAYSGVIQALVMGDDSQISQSDWQVFLRTGTTHLMSISGLHITMLSGLVFMLVGFVWRRVPRLAMYLPTRKAATAAGFVAALIYALIAGFSIPTQRTLYMLMVFGVVLWSGRQLAISQVLALALLIVVIFDPWAVISAGFWLSFGAVAILAYALSARIGQIYWLKAAVKTQWVVTIGMLPLLLVLFNQVSIISPLANAFAIPLISFVVTPLALAGSFLQLDGLIQCSHQILSYGMAALKWLNQLPSATWQQHSPPTWTLIPAMLGVLWFLLPRGWPLRWLGLLGLVPMFCITPMKPLIGEMKVTVLDVGQGLSVVVQTASHALLYDAGPKFGEQKDAGARIIMPFLRGEGIRKLDGFIVSHDDIDHSGGMASMLNEIPVNWLSSSFTPQFESPEKPIWFKCAAGQHWQWDGVTFEVMYPALVSYEDVSIKDNNRSCVLKITSRSGSLLLTGDIEKEAEASLLATHGARLRSTAMIAPHHGSRTSSTPDFIAAVQPDIGIFTVGYLNRFKHPKPLIIERYKALGSQIYRSDQHGAIQLAFRGPESNTAKSEVEHKNIQIHAWRKERKRYWQEAAEVKPE